MWNRLIVNNILPISHNGVKSMNPSFLFQLIFLALGVGVVAGCRNETPVSMPPPTPDPAPVDFVFPQEQNSQKLEKPVDVTPRQLLEKTVAVYKAAFSYSDHGQVSMEAKMLDPEALPEPWPCTVAFQRNGQSCPRLRLEISDGKLVDDGVDVFAQIRSMPDQVLRFPAPDKISVENIFHDFFLDQSMELGIPEAILRFPPQWVLLFAQDPLKTFLPETSQVELREPQWIGDIPCDLIRVTDTSGSRLLWLSRKNHALVRFDYFIYLCSYCGLGFYAL